MVFQCCNSIGSLIWKDISLVSCLYLPAFLVAKPTSISSCLIALGLEILAEKKVHIWFLHTIFLAT